MLSIYEKEEGLCLWKKKAVMKASKYAFSLILIVLDSKNGVGKGIKSFWPHTKTCIGDDDLLDTGILWLNRLMNDARPLNGKCIIISNFTSESQPSK